MASFMEEHIRTKNPKEYFIKNKSNYYPRSYYKLIELGLVDFDIWYVLYREYLSTRYKGLKKHYPRRQLIPFARRDDNDDVACFEIGEGERVQIIHDFSSSGYEQRGEFKTLWDWVKSAIDDLVIYNDED